MIWHDAKIGVLARWTRRQCIKDDGRTDKREILSAALSAHVSELRLFWRETGLSCRWLVPDGEHCYVDREMVEHLRTFRAVANETIEHDDVCAQWIEKVTPLLEEGEDGAMPFSLRTLTWLLRVVESPHRDDMTIDAWNLYLWNVRLSDLPSQIMRKLVDYLDNQGKQALIDFDTLVGRFVTALQASMPDDTDKFDRIEQLTLVKRFDRLRRFKNLVFYGVPCIGKANLSKQIISHWQEMTGREIGMHCVTPFHWNVKYENLVERRISSDMGAARPMIENCAPRVLAHHVHDAKFFFEPYTNDNIEDGLLLSLCRAAAYNPDKDYVFMVDGIDEAELEDVFGEISHMLDSFARVPWRKAQDGSPGAWDLEAPGARSIRLCQSGRLFFIPANVYILGTANSNTIYAKGDNSRLLQSFAVEQLYAKTPSELRAAMLAGRCLEAFARLEQYVDHSVELWAKINEILMKVGGHGNIIGYGPLLSMCEEILDSSDVLDANRIVLGTWRYRMIPLIHAKMEALLSGTEAHRLALDELLSCLTQSWLRVNAQVEGVEGSESIYMAFEPEFVL